MGRWIWLYGRRWPLSWPQAGQRNADGDWIRAAADTDGEWNCVPPCRSLAADIDDGHAYDFFARHHAVCAPQA